MRQAENAAPGLQLAIERWREALAGAVETEGLGWHLSTTSGIEHRIPAVLRPKSVEEVVAVVRIASETKTPIHPVSTGRNWGYGSALPVRDDVAVLDLSGLSAIRDFDPELGLLTVEPGVTQGRLAAFLDAGGHSFMVPTTGAGPSCGLLSNALERGFGMAPNCDHFTAVAGLEAVLADGRIYRSPLADIGAFASAGAYKWGFGPYVDGLFAQGGFGIVTAMTLSLEPRPERVFLAMLRLREDVDVGELAACGRRAMAAFPGVLSTIKFSNRRLAMATVDPYPWDRLEQGVVSDDAVAAFGRANGVSPWIGMAAIHGEKRVAAAALRGLRRAFAGQASQMIVVSRARLALLEKGLGLFDWAVPERLARKVDALRGTFNLVDGRPDEIALPLAYWRSPRARPGRPLDHARDGCGLLWYAPLIPAKGQAVRQYVEMAERVMRAHRIEPLITLSALSPRVYDSTVPILFDPSSAEEVARARACHDALLEEGLALGVAPYRYGVQAMDWLAAKGSGFHRLASQIRSCVDPANVISPGRYSS